MHIYINDKIEQYDEDDVRRLLCQLPEWRREQALRFRHLTGQCECAVAYLLLYKGLQEEFNISRHPHFIIGPHGKPTLQEHPDIHFNLSHCKKAVLCALSDRPIGADIERFRNFDEGLAHYTMNSKEYAQISLAENPSIRFTELWTAKEAVVKCSGRGLQNNIPDILTRAQREGIVVRTCSFPEKGYAYSIANHE